MPFHKTRALEADPPHGPHDMAMADAAGVPRAASASNAMEWELFAH